MGSRSHPHRVLSVSVCICVSRCLWVCVIEADSLQLRVITVGLYLFLSRSLLCQILAVFAVVVYGPFWFRDSWALLLPGLRSPDLGCPLLPCATRLCPTESSVSAYGKLRFCLRKAPPLPYGKLRFCLRKAPPLPRKSSTLVSRCVLLPVINSLFPQLNPPVFIVTRIKSVLLIFTQNNHRYLLHSQNLSLEWHFFTNMHTLCINMYIQDMNRLCIF